MNTRRYIFCLPTNLNKKIAHRSNGNNHSNWIKNVIFCLLMCVICIGSVAGQESDDCLQLKNYEEKEPTLKAALGANIKNFGKGHPAVLQYQSDLAGLYQELGQYDKAEDLLKDALDAAIKDYGNKHEKTAKLQMELAQVYLAKGLYLDAMKQAEAALNTNEEVLGNHASTAESCMILTKVSQELGQYDRAKNLLERAVTINTQVLGADHDALVAISQAELALLYYALGEYEKAEILFESIVATDFKDVNEQNIDLSNYQSNLASIYFKFEKYEQAKKILEQALENDLKNFCEDHPKIARHQTNLSKIYFRMGEYMKAKDLITSALELNLKHYDKKHPIVSENYVDLAMIYQILEDEYDLELPSENIPGFKTREAEQKKRKTISDLAEAASFIRGGDSGTNSHPVLKILDVLIATDESYEIASQYADDENHEKAKLLWGHIITNTIKDMNKHCRLLPADERLMYVQKQMRIFDKFYSFSTRQSDNKVVWNIANTSSVIKYIGLDYSRSLRRRILKSKNKKLIDLYQQYIAKKKLLGEAYLLTQQELEQKKWNIVTMKKELSGLESDLLKNRKVRVLSRNILIKDFDKLGLNLTMFDKITTVLVNSTAVEPTTTPNTVAAVDFLRFNYHNGKHFTDSIMYYALIYGGQERSETMSVFNMIDFIPLTDEKTLAPLLKIREGDYLPAYVRSEKERKQLHELIWQPLEYHLQGVKYVQLSPTNLLHRLDFGALQDNYGQYLNERFELHYGDIFDNSKPPTYVNGKPVIKRYKGALLIGNIAYDKSQIIEKRKCPPIYLLPMLQQKIRYNIFRESRPTLFTSLHMDFL